MTQVAATVLLILLVAAFVSVAFFSIRRFGTENALTHSILLVFPPLALWPVWASRGRGAPLGPLLLVGVCTGFIAAAGWRLQRTERRRKYHRYQVLAMTVIVPATFVISDLALGLSATLIAIAAVIGTIVGC